MPALNVHRQVFLHALAAAKAPRALAVFDLNLVGLAKAVGAPIQAVDIEADNRGHEKDLLSSMKKAPLQALCKTSFRVGNPSSKLK